MLYTMAMFLLRAILPVIARISVYGLDNLPSKSTNYVTVFNHIGRLDPAVIYYLLNRKDIIALVAEKYRHYAWSHIVVNAVDGIFVDRYNADLNALREVLRRLNRGGVLILAPEGTRSRTSSLNRGWDGASYIASRSGLPIVPVGLTGCGDREAVTRLRSFQRLDVQVHIGAAFTLPALESEKRSQQLADYTEEIMCRIAAELPGPYRGIYADCPRLGKLLNDKSGQALSKNQGPA